jgi:cold shock CspA family protein
VKIGRICALLKDKGFAFIAADGLEVFAHHTDFPTGRNMLPVGSMVQFETMEFRGKTKAINIVLLPDGDEEAL